MYSVAVYTVMIVCDKQTVVPCRDDAWRKAMWTALSTCPDVNRSQQKAVLAAAFSTLTLWQVSTCTCIGVEYPRCLTSQRLLQFIGVRVLMRAIACTGTARYWQNTCTPGTHENVGVR